MENENIPMVKPKFGLIVPIGQGVAPKWGPPVDAQLGEQYIKTRHFLIATVVILVFALILTYETAFLEQHLHFLDGYPRLRTPPRPNFYRSARYSWSWWIIWSISSLNYLLNFLFAFAFLNNVISDWAWIHSVFSRVMLLLNVLYLALLIILWIFFCNSSDPSFTFCHDPRWCGVHYADSFEASKWCANHSPFVPAVTGGELSVPPEFLQLVIFALVMVGMAFVNKQLNGKMREWGFFQDVY